MVITNCFCNLPLGGEKNYTAKNKRMYLYIYLENLKIQLIQLEPLI